MKMITKPKGTYDIIDKEATKMKIINRAIDYFCEFYHYEYIRTPIFESRDLFHRTVGEETDIVTKETYDFKDRSDRELTLRPEGTAGVVRSFIETKCMEQIFLKSFITMEQCIVMKDQEMEEIENLLNLV